MQTMNDTRSHIVDLLAPRAGQAVAATLEKHIYSTLFPDDEEDEDGRENYQHLLYNFVYLMNTAEDTDAVVRAVMRCTTLEELLRTVYVCRPELAENQRTRDDYITNPMEVSEGVEPCPKCRGTKSYSYQKQLRSGDEGFSTICTCANPKCRYRWRIN